MTKSAGRPSSPSRAADGAAPLGAAQFRALAGTRQPICLIGDSGRARFKAAGIIHREMIGKEIILESPHPDLSILTPPSRSDPDAPRSIGIESVQQFVDRMSLTPYDADVRIGYIEPASALTDDSQNALLHFLEEPPETCRVILSTRRREDILPTLVSRCLSVRIAGKSGENGEADDLAGRYDEDVKTVSRLLDVMDDPDAVERLLEFKLGAAALDVVDCLARGCMPDSQGMNAFFEKKPATEYSRLFAQTAFAAAVQRAERADAGQAGGRGSDPPGLRSDSVRIAQRLLELQPDIRYNPSRVAVIQTILDWMVDGGPECQNARKAAS